LRDELSILLAVVQQACQIPGDVRASAAQSDDNNLPYHLTRVKSVGIHMFFLSVWGIYFEIYVGLGQQL